MMSSSLLYLGFYCWGAFLSFGLSTLICEILFWGERPFCGPFWGGLCWSFDFYLGSAFYGLLLPFMSFGFYFGMSFWFTLAFVLGYYFDRFFSGCFSGILVPFLASLLWPTYGLAFFSGYFLVFLSSFAFFKSLAFLSSFTGSFWFLPLSFYGDFLAFLSWRSLAFFTSLGLITGYYLTPFLSVFFYASNLKSKNTFLIGGYGLFLFWWLLFLSGLWFLWGHL